VAAGKRAAVVAKLRQQTDRILHGRRTMIGESAWYHWASSLTASMGATIVTEAADRRAQYLLRVPILTSCAPQQQSTLH
jgi:hypothetical protein